MNSISVNSFIKNFDNRFSELADRQPWEIISELQQLIIDLMDNLNKNDFYIDNGIAIHKSAQIEQGVVLKAPAIISKNCFIGANAYLRNGIYLDDDVIIGPGCEIKSTIIFDKTSVAHFNFIGDSILGSRVNIEAGAVVANHFNERTNKLIEVRYEGKLINTACTKFGSLIGDDVKIGANAVLSPGTLLNPGSIVKRLELVIQSE